ncbi:MAG: SMP-30/gluconolactonase/LRE family protein, partial [Acidobacteria bacterium]|nr:SMP-30/gluconolactonase/LRE family protein [Acidobacteriota bacterium]
LSEVLTVAGTGEARFTEPFGVAVGSDSTVYVTDGDAGRLWRIKPDGSASVVAEKLETPSAVAVAPDGSLVLAETGAHVIRRVSTSDGRAEIVAGIKGRAGYADGKASEALFNAPIGVAVASDGTIFVADTYNDRIRAIDKDGNVRTMAGGEAGFADSANGAEARFDTPCGIAVAPDGALIVADTGNQRLRRVELNGGVRTIAGTGERASEDGDLSSAAFNEPTGLAVDKEGTVFVTDARSSALRVYAAQTATQVSTLIGSYGSGFHDGALKWARLNHPRGIAVAPDGTLLVADTGNRIVRAVVGAGRERGTFLNGDAVSALFPTAAEMRRAAEPRWPYEPPSRPREIAATFGEIRGALTLDDRDAYFHNGLDIPGAYGERVRAVRSERILNPLPVEDVGTARERIRFPTLGYIHVRIGRDVNDRALDESKFLIQRDAQDKVVRVRVRRGTLFEAGETIGTLNNQYHVHLIAGTVGAEYNALAALELPGIKDTVAPTIEKDGVSFFDSAWRELHAKSANERLTVEGDVRIVVRAYDQMDGNAARRRLGIYRLGYQVLDSNGTPAPGFQEPLVTISFESLPPDESSAQLAYASGSRAGATGETIFAYILTDIVRDREAKEGVWSASKLAAGDYIVRVFAEDFFGNRTTRDTPVHVSTANDR